MISESKRSGMTASEAGNPREERSSDLLSPLRLICSAHSLRVLERKDDGPTRVSFLREELAKSSKAGKIPRKLRKVLSLKFDSDSSGSLDYAAAVGCAVLLGVMEVCADYDKKFFDRISVDSLLSLPSVLKGLDFQSVIQHMKYYTSYWMAVFMHRFRKREGEYPEKPKGVKNPWGFTGSMYQYLRTRSLDQSSKTATMFWGLFHTKACCFEVDDTFIHGAHEKHRGKLGEKAPEVDSDVAAFIDRKMPEILKGWSKFVPKVYQFSKSASFESNCAKGGQSRFILERAGRIRTERYELTGEDYDFYSDVFSKVPDGRVQYFIGTPWEYSMEQVVTDDEKNDKLIVEYIIARHELLSMEVVRGEVREVRGIPPLSHEELELEVIEYELNLNRRTSFIESFAASQKEVDDHAKLLTEMKPIYAKRKIMDCSVADIKEPLKVRMVTKGRSIAYAYVHDVQKWIHNNLRKIPQFALIGETVTVDRLLWLRALNEKHAIPGSKHYWVSGDYSAATDGLNLNVTKRVFERILDLVESPVKKIVSRRVLYEHRISYPTDKAYPKGDFILQGNGQLMGSPLSFPILCIVNLLTYWYTVCPWRTLSRLAVLINGDDSCFQATIEQYNSWSSGLSKFGFTKSVGKNYINPRYAIINSRLHDMVGNRSLPHFRSGLLMGRAKVAPMTTDEVPAPVQNLETCLEGSRDTLRTVSRFMAYHHKDIEPIVQNRSLFLGPEFGGFGLKSYGYKYTLSSFQLKLAQGLTMNTETDYVVRRTWGTKTATLVAHHFVQVFDPDMNRDAYLGSKEWKNSFHESVNSDFLVNCHPKPGFLKPDAIKRINELPEINPKTLESKHWRYCLK